MEQKELRSQTKETEQERMERIRRHPKGSCCICGKLKNMTLHHLKSGKTIPLCRKCHDEIEKAKVYINSMKSRKSAFKKGAESQLKDDLKEEIDWLDKIFVYVKSNIRDNQGIKGIIKNRINKRRKQIENGKGNKNNGKR